MKLERYRGMTWRIAIIRFLFEREILWMIAHCDSSENRGEMIRAIFKKDLINKIVSSAGFRDIEHSIGRKWVDRLLKNLGGK